MGVEWPETIKIRDSVLEAKRREKRVIYTQHAFSNSLDCVVVNGLNEALSYFHVSPTGKVDYQKVFDKPKKMTSWHQHGQIVKEVRTEWISSVIPKKSLPSDASLGTPKQQEVTEELQEENK